MKQKEGILHAKWSAEYEKLNKVFCEYMESDDVDNAKPVADEMGELELVEPQFAD